MTLCHFYGKKETFKELYYLPKLPFIGKKKSNISKQPLILISLSDLSSRENSTAKTQTLFRFYLYYIF